MLTHVGFSDDSKHEGGRYNSLGLVTLQVEAGAALSAELKQLLSESGFVSEFKWADCSSAKHRFAAEKMMDFVLGNMKELRIDVLLWDNHDSRHAVPGRDDGENLVRMYYHLLSTTLSKRWPIDGGKWLWIPDEQSSVDWATLQKCLRAKKHPCVADLFRLSPEFENVNVSVKPGKSHERVFIQLADLFAGLGAYSWGHFARFQKWIDQQKGEHLFGREDISISKSERERFSLLCSFKEKCRARNMKISLESSGGLRSYVPTKRINFWVYRPQHPKDKAPVHHKNH